MSRVRSVRARTVAGGLHSVLGAPLVQGRNIGANNTGCHENLVHRALPAMKVG